MTRFRLSRRALLRGAGGVAVGLPFLEIMADGRAARAAAAPPLRYLVTFAGIAGATDATASPFLLPPTTGADYLTGLNLSPASATSPGVHALKPLADLKLGPDVTVVSNLRLPKATGPAHWSERWHPPTMRPLLSGTSGNGKFDLTSPTSDGLVADKLGRGVRFPHLAVRGQPQKYRFSEGGPNASAGGRMSATAAGPIEPFVDPGQVYDQLFGAANPAGGQPELGPMEDRAVVDLVLARAQRLRQRLGSADGKRLDQHLQELRDLETRLGTLPPATQCKPPAKPSATFPTDLTDKSGWSNETLRCQLMSDLVYMAFVCDLVRVGSLMYTYASSYTAVTNILGRTVTGDLHELTHSAGDARSGSDLAKAWAWHIGFWATLVDKLRATQEGGQRLLDSCMILFMTEAGYGVEAGATAALNDNFGAHSGNNMIMLLAGRAGGRFTPRGHVDGNKAHPTQVLVSAMKAVGVDQPLGEITAGLPQLS